MDIEVVPSSKVVTVRLLKTLVSSTVLPIVEIAKRLDLNRPASQELLRRQARYLRKRGYISGDARAGYAITSWGRQRLQELEFGMIAQTGRWDKKWRLVIFDIPEDKRKARDAVRRLIKQLGFKRLQHSIWIHPLPCLVQFERIRAAYGVKSHLMLLEVTHLEDESALLRHFRKLYPNL